MYPQITVGNAKVTPNNVTRKILYGFLTLLNIKRQK